MGPVVLVVEDEPMVAAFIKRVIADAGFQPEVVHRAADAIAYLDSHPGDDCPAALIADAKLPDAPGISVVRRYRVLCSRPVLCITGWIDWDLPVDLQEAEDVKLLRKPFQGAGLLECISSLLASIEAPGNGA